MLLAELYSVVEVSGKALFGVVLLVHGLQLFPLFWREALLGLLQNPNLRNEVAARGRARALNTYDWNIVARAHLEFFGAILRERGGDASPRITRTTRKAS